MSPKAKFMTKYVVGVLAWFLKILCTRTTMFPTVPKRKLVQLATMTAMIKFGGTSYSFDVLLLVNMPFGLR